MKSLLHLPDISTGLSSKSRITTSIMPIGILRLNVSISDNLHKLFLLMEFKMKSAIKLHLALYPLYFVKSITAVAIIQISSDIDEKSIICIILLLIHCNAHSNASYV